eukprot:gene3658-biopygen9271
MQYWVGAVACRAAPRSLTHSWITRWQARTHISTALYSLAGLAEDCINLHRRDATDGVAPEGVPAHGGPPSVTQPASTPLNQKG